MRGWTVSLGTYFGVEVRLHFWFALALPVMVLLSSTLDGAGLRGVGLWLFLLFAVLVREIGRGLVHAARGVKLTRLVLLPTGAVPDGIDDAIPLKTQRLIALAGPVANFAVGMTLALLMYTATAQINLFERPLFSPLHLVRSAIWAQIFLGGLNLLPAVPLDAGLVLRNQFALFRGKEAAVRATNGVSQGVALVLLMLGAATQNAWLAITGCSILLTGRDEAQVAAMTSSAASTSLLAEEVMLTEFTTLSASDTFEDAARRCVRSMQDVFPVARGPVVVGAISRQALLNAMITDGNAYVQSVMAKSLTTLAPGDPLLPALQQVGQERTTQLITVVDEERVVGIITPGQLSQSVSVLGRLRRSALRDARRDSRG